MKVQKSNQLSAFGGMNYVLNHLDKLQIESIINQHLPELSAQSKYNWKDIFNSLYSLYLCGGDAIEDLGTHLKGHFVNNPFVKIPSPDTVLTRMKQLAQPMQTCMTKRGKVNHNYSTNRVLDKLNISLLKKLGAFNADELTLDYDNTIIFSEKQDCKMTYKRQKGYQPGVCTINEKHILYIENRGGNSDAKSFQDSTLQRVFSLLRTNNCARIDNFRADAASYQYDVIKLVEANVNSFFIGCRNSYVEKNYSKITSWEPMTDRTGEEMEVGEIDIIPFESQAKKDSKTAKSYRLIVKRKRNKTGQINIITNDDYDYRSILTNNKNLSSVESAWFYNQRGNMEKQFDILKNDFGWNNMPFSQMNQNTVFLYFTAMFRNIYNNIIQYFSQKAEGLKPNFRLKKFLFRFIILPAKWIKRSRQMQLRIYGNIPINT